jgi:MFS superfamily sulfate permease-like transporter
VDRDIVSPIARVINPLRRDLPASLVVFLVAAPRSLGIAPAWGAPIIAGLIGAVASDKLHSGVRPNLEKKLRAQGIGNLVSGLLGGLPITGVIVRSSVNILAGSASR